MSTWSFLWDLPVKEWPGQSLDGVSNVLGDARSSAARKQLREEPCDLSVALSCPFQIKSVLRRCQVLGQGRVAQDCSKHSRGCIRMDAALNTCLHDHIQLL